jgi:antitoxin component YwqK of YwqJK toxin-antitoxin module
MTKLIILITLSFIMTQCEIPKRNKNLAIHNEGNFEDSLMLRNVGKIDKDGRKIGKWTGYFSNSKVGYVGYYKNGLKDSSWYYYNDRGILEKKEQYINGLKNGITSIYSDGNLYDEVEFVNDKKHGKHTHYYSPTKVNFYQGYKDGYFDGDFILFFEDGAVKQKGKFSHGRCIGEWVEFSSNGSIIEKTIYYSDSKKYREIKFNQNKDTISDIIK